MENAPAVLTTPPPAALTSWTAQDAGLPMPIQVDLVVARVLAVQEIISKVFKEGSHFGVIPGTGTKKTLLKPGFDMLCLAFKFSPEFVKQPESIETDKMINVVYKCRLIQSETGRVIATGDGSCNSKEEKYRWTTTAKKCPSCGAEAIIKGKQEYGGGWVCFERKGGCKAKWPDGAKEIEGQVAGRVENDNPWNFHNTLTKMAQKRAGMAAIITACGLSSDFTQDLEDIAENQRAAHTTRDEYSQDGDYSPAPAEQPKPQEKVYTAQEIHDQVTAGAAACLTVENLSAFKALLFQKNGLWFSDHVKDILRYHHTRITGVVRSATLDPMEAKVLEKVVAGVKLSAEGCLTKVDFDTLKAACKDQGGAFLHPDVVQAISSAYRAKFPDEFHPNGDRKTVLETAAAH